MCVYLCGVSDSADNMLSLACLPLLWFVLQCESKKIPPPRGPDIFSFFSQTVDNL